jgi:prepilin-type N-terminal cleavage/methylation domain-containing protein
MFFQTIFRDPSRRRRLRAFTLVEVLIVVLIMAVVSAVAIQSFQASIADANVASLMETFRRIEGAAARYRARNGDWPSTTTQSNAPGDFQGYIDATAFTDAVPSGVSSHATVKYYNNAFGVFCTVPYMQKDVAESIDSESDDGVGTTGRVRVSTGSGITQLLYVILNLGKSRGSDSDSGSSGGGLSSDSGSSSGTASSGLSLD